MPRTSTSVAVLLFFSSAALVAERAAAQPAGLLQAIPTASSPIGARAGALAPAPAKARTPAKAPAKAPAPTKATAAPSPPKLAPTRSFGDWVQALPYEPVFLWSFIISAFSGVGFLFVVKSLIGELVWGLLPYKYSVAAMRLSPLQR